LTSSTLVPLPAATREKLLASAVRLGESVSYRSAGTIEYIYDQQRDEFYFLEVNTRLQVEHPVTEWITGLDLVSLQLDIAAGRPLNIQLDDKPHGHAIEARIYAEDPSRGFIPQPGHIDQLRIPTGPFVRDDSGVYSGVDVTPFYDPMIAKLSAWGATREQAIARLDRALQEYTVRGLKTNIQFLRQVLANEVFCSGDYDTGLIEQHMSLDEPQPSERKRDVAILAAALYAHQQHKAQSIPRSRDSQTGGRSAWQMVGSMQRRPR